jgi:hypothetical protein
MLLRVQEVSNTGHVQHGGNEGGGMGRNRRLAEAHGALPLSYGTTRPGRSRTDYNQVSKK